MANAASFACMFRSIESEACNANTFWKVDVETIAKAVKKISQTYWRIPRKVTRFGHKPGRQRVEIPLSRSSSKNTMEWKLSDDPQFI